MDTLKLTTAQALVEFLNNQYVEVDGKKSKFVEGVFTIFGHGNVLGLGQALEERGADLIVHQGKNEQGMAHAAIGFAKQNNRQKIYAVTSSVGPGSANLVTAAATATANRIPVLLLPGDTFADRQPDPVLQQLEQFDDLSITTNDALKPVSKYWDRIYRPEQLMSALINAMRVLTSPADCGAVTICLPQDVQGESYDFPKQFFAPRVHRIERTRPTAAMLADALALFKTKKRPLIICGGGVKYSAAATELAAFAEDFNIPIAETQAGKSALSWLHPLVLGGIGTTGNYAANVIAKKADLIIGIGTRYSDFTTASKWLFQGQDVDFLNINVAAFDAYKLDAVKLIGDAKAVLQDLHPLLKEAGYRSAYQTEIAAAKQAWQDELTRLDNISYDDETFVAEVASYSSDKLTEFIAATGSSLTQTAVLGVVNQAIDDDAIVVGASGSIPGDLQRIWRPTVANSYHMEYGYSCMGYEVNAALGVKLAQPDVEVYALVGDGSYEMLHSELITSVQEGVKINVVLLDNISFGCINNLQMGNGMGSYCTETRKRTANGLDGQLLMVDFAQNAASYGCKTYTVKTLQQLRSALADAKKQTVSTLIDIKVLPKTMTEGYEAFWRVGNATVADKKAIVEATDLMNEEMKKARKY